MFTSCPESVNSTSTGPGVSDHDHTVITRVALKPHYQRKKPRSIHLFNKANWDQIKGDLSKAGTAFEKDHISRSTEGNWCFLRDNILEAIGKHVPKKTISGRHRKPWMTREITRLVRKKDRWHKRAKKSGKEKDMLKFQDLRKEAQRTMRSAHNSYLNKVISEDGNKGLWRYVKNQKKSSSGVGTLAANGKAGITPIEKAQMLNDQFTSVFTQDQADTTPDLGPSPFPQMAKISIAEDGVCSLLSKQNPKKASGADNIPAIILKNCAAEISPMLTTIIQQSLDTGDVPGDWRKATVSPVFKKGDRANPENYRPISLTSICCKIFENIIVSEMMKSS